MKQFAKDDYRTDLRPYFFRFRMLVKLLHHRFGIRLVNFILGLSKGSKVKGLICEEVWIPNRSGGKHKIRVRIYRPSPVDHALPAMLYVHGGGYELGVPEQVNELYAAYIATRPVIIVAPDYRLSVRHPFPAGFNDCYDTLLWMKENQKKLGISTDRFIVAGHSAGGGMAAALSLKARDTGEINIAFQMPVYPMLDHRQDTPSCLKSEKTPLWDAPANRLAWSLYLKDLEDKQQTIPSYASPALNKDYKDLPPTISFVGSLEPFADETVEYMEALKNAGVEVNFQVFEGVFHAAEGYTLKSAYAHEANQFQHQAFGEFYDRNFITKQ